MNNTDLAATVAQVKPGDEVTATFRATSGAATRAATFAISGSVWKFDDLILVGREVLRNRDGHTSVNLTNLVVHKAAPDPEPPIGSVVLDDDGDAWQGVQYGSRVDWLARGEHIGLSWRRLNDIYGPLRVIYTPEVTP